MDHQAHLQFGKPITASIGDLKVDLKKVESYTVALSHPSFKVIKSQILEQAKQPQKELKLTDAEFVNCRPF